MKNIKRSAFKSRKQKEIVGTIVSVIVIIFMSAVVLLPIWLIFRTSLITNAEIYAYPPGFFPGKWLFSNYQKTLETFKFWRYLANTMIIIVPSVIGGTLTATLSGYAFARLRFRGKKSPDGVTIPHMKKPKDVDAYISGFPITIQKVLKQLRVTVKKAAPQALEVISYECRRTNFMVCWFGLRHTPNTSAFTRLPRG